MAQPDGFNDNSGRVCRLNKSLYGLKQYSRCWNKKFTAFVRSFGLVASKADNCVFISKKDKEVIILATYIDDGLLAVSDERYAREFVGRLCEEFLTIIQDLSYFLGLEIALKDDGSICLHQETYARKILERFGMVEYNPVSVPIDPQGIITSSNLRDSKLASDVPYREIAGSLLYLSTNSRLDIAYAVSYVSQHMTNPTVTHWSVLKRILRYIKETLDFGIKFTPNFNKRLHVFSDADFAGDLSTRRSQPASSLYLVRSTTESEYIAASEAVKELLWLQLLFEEIFLTGFPCCSVTTRARLSW